MATLTELVELAANGNWTDLGTCPALVELVGTASVLLVVADSAPDNDSHVGHSLGAGDSVLLDFSGMHVYARARSGAAKIISTATPAA